MRLANERYVPAYDIATIHASLGDADRAFEWLDGAVAERAHMLGFFPIDPRLMICAAMRA